MELFLLIVLILVIGGAAAFILSRIAPLLIAAIIVLLVLVIAGISDCASGDDEVSGVSPNLPTLERTTPEPAERQVPEVDNCEDSSVEDVPEVVQGCNP